jgi:hypothetical protein
MTRLQRRIALDTAEVLRRRADDARLAPAPAPVAPLVVTAEALAAWFQRRDEVAGSPARSRVLPKGR